MTKDQLRLGDLYYTSDKINFLPLILLKREMIPRLEKNGYLHFWCIKHQTVWVLHISEIIEL